MLKRLILSFWCILNVTIIFAYNYDLVLKSSYPANEQKLSSLSHIDLEFDLSNYYIEEGDSDVIGMRAMIAKNKIKVYKGGDANTGTLLGSCPSSLTKIDYVAGTTSLSINLGTTFELEDGVLYTIVLPKSIIWAAKGTATSDIVAYFDACEITVYGGEEETFNFLNSTPVNGSEVNGFGAMEFKFNEAVELADDAKASLYDGSTLLKEASLAVSSDNKDVATVDFGSVSCTAATKYTVSIPKEAIKSSNTGTTLSYPISLSFTGYELFGYKSVSPASGSVLSTIGSVSLVPNFPDGRTYLNYANDGYTRSVSLYKGTDDTGELVGTYEFDSNNAGNAVVGKVDATLVPGETYALVLPQDLVPYVNDNGNGKKIAGYYSAPLTILYIGENSPLDGKWSVTENDQLSKLGIVSFMTGGTATANEGAKILLYNGEDSIASATLNASGTLCYADFGGLALEQDGDYSLIIPDSAIVNMPKTTQKFKGIAKPAEYATVSYKAGNTTIVADSVLVGSKVAFNVIDADTLALDSLTLNGASVELTDSAYVIDSIAANADLAAAIRYIPTPQEYIDVTYKSAGATLETKNVLKGTQLTFNVAECDTLKLDSLVLNGMNVTDSIANGSFTTDSLTENTVIEANMQYIQTPAPETKFYAVNYAVKSIVGSEESEITSSSTMVAEDSVFTFKAPELDENWSVEVSAGEISEDSTYSIAMASDTAVVVTCTFIGEVSYVDETTTGIFDVNGNEVKISTTEGKIVVEGAQAGDVISLYGLNGAKLGNWTVEKTRQTIDVNSGVYLVVVKGDGGKAAAKVSVK